MMKPAAPYAYLLLLLALLLACPATHAAELEVIASTEVPFDGKMLTILSDASINNRDEVAFFGTFAAGQGVFTQDGLLVSTGDTIGGRTITGIGRLLVNQGNLYNDAPVINDLGEVAFFASFDGGHGIFTQNRLVVEIGDTIDGRIITEIARSPSINTLGDVTFKSKFAGGSGIFTQDRLVVVEGGSFNGLGTGFLDWLPSINDSGIVAFAAGLGIGGRVFAENGFFAASGMIIDGKMLSGASRPSINNLGDVAFRGLLSAPDGTLDSAIFTQDELVFESGNTVDG